MFDRAVLRHWSMDGAPPYSSSLTCSPHVTGLSALIVDFLHRYVGHEALGGGTVPVVLSGLEEHPLARADHLDLLSAAALAEAYALGDVDSLCPYGWGCARRFWHQG